MFDWEEGDRFSFEDSDRFEEDSLCSWISEPESVCNNWRGWKKPATQPALHNPGAMLSKQREDGPSFSLVELAAREVACHIPFEVVEHVYPPVPEQIQLRIAFWSFPENEEDIRLYSCLANGSSEEFGRGEHLFKCRSVKDPLQIGFHLSATVIPVLNGSQAKTSYNVAVIFDRRRITSCNCTCSSTASWCSHVVAVCLHRIHLPHQVCLRAPVSESLSRLHRDQLQKFAQYLISELPQQILPTAQRLLDELLSCQQSAINTVCGAPDPTAGASANEQTTWCLDEDTLHENIHKILIKFCVPSPMVFSDVNYLSSTAPPAAAEWSSLLRPLRGREPEGMWNLLSIVREMYRRNDRNAVPLLEVLTDECLSCDQILIWWFNTKVSLHNGNIGHGNRGGINSNTHASQHACSSLCDEMVVLWRLAALNPALSPQERKVLCMQLKEWHLKTIEKMCKARVGSGGAGAVGGTGAGVGGTTVRKADIEIFTGFKSAIEACFLDWDDYSIAGVTYGDGVSTRYYHPYTYHRTQESHSREVSTSLISSTGDHLSTATAKRARAVDFSHSHDRKNIFHVKDRMVASRCATSGPQGALAAAAAASASSTAHTDGNRSSVSSEGFCENEQDSPEGKGNPLDGDSAEETQEVLGNKTDKDFLDDASRKSTSESPDESESNQGPKGEQAAVAAGECLPSTSAGRENFSPEEPDSDWSSAPESAGMAAAGGNHKARPSRAAGDTKEGTGKFEHWESQQSSDEYQVYYYDPKAKLSPERPKERKTDEANIFAGIKKFEDPWEILFARAEALHAHGHSKEAIKLAVKLAEELLANPPEFMIGLPPAPTKGKRKKKINPASHQISCLASATLAKAAFLCTVLSESPEHYHLAFCVGIYGLEMARPPASTKALEVKLANQESDLVNLLKRIPLGIKELKMIRERAENLRDGKLRSRGDSLLPLNLTSFIFEALCLLGTTVRGSTQLANGRLATDEQLGFEAAVAALGLKANVSEADHPLLCEGTRRQRGDLGLTLLVHYKDDQEKLAKIMDKLLDKEIHQMYKAPTTSCYYSNKPQTNQPVNQANTTSTPQNCRGKLERLADDDESGKPVSTVSSIASTNSVTSKAAQQNGGCGPASATEARLATEGESGYVNGISHHGNGSGSSQSYSASSVREPTRHGRMNGRGGDDRQDASSPTWEEDYKAWEAKFRCTNFRTQKKHSAGMASIDSSAPETTSSDNSPTLIRRSGWGKPVGPGSDSGSSGKSSDSFGSSSSGDKAGRSKVRENESPPPNFVASAIKCVSLFNPETPARSVTPNVKIRFKGKRSYPSVPNQPSEASAHFMFELAKTVLTKGGGNSSTALFTQQSTNQNHRGPHRALHMCAFQIGLYALGLQNCVSPNWLSRTYSSHVSWITSQALEIGVTAITFLIEVWDGHLTPPEVASLADRASRGRDIKMVRASAELALSCLPRAHALNPNEIQRAIMQCKEQNNEMLERACLAVESAAKGGGVYPEVLFDVAKHWYDLYGEATPNQPSSSTLYVANGGMPVPPPGVHIDATQGIQENVDAPGIAMPLDLNAMLEPAVSLAQDSALAAAAVAAVSMVTQPIPTLQQVAVTIPGPHPLPYSLPPPMSIPFTCPSPYSYMQTVATFTQSPLAPPPLHAHAYLPAPFPYSVAATGFSIPTQTYYTGPHCTLAGTTAIRPLPVPTVYAPQLCTLPMQTVQPRPPPTALLSQGHSPPPPLPPSPPMHAMPQVQQALGHPQQPLVRGPITPVNQTQLNYLLSAYRVGMLAMETLARRVHDDRPNAKYARNPPYGDDVKWLLGVAKKLGTSYVQQFCLCTVNSVVSPFLLYEIACDAAHYMSRSNPAQTFQHLRSPVLTPLVQKCQQMFIQCTHVKMFHLTPTEYDEFVNIIRSARTAFQMTPGGMVHFNELLQSLRRAKTCRKDLWQKIASGLQSSSV